VSADRGENHDPTGDISRTDGKGSSKGLTRIPGIRERCRPDHMGGLTPFFSKVARVAEADPSGFF
jgi:hypothetical protein